MSELDEILADAVARQDAPFLVAMTGDASGVTWSGAAGERSPRQPATIDTVFRIYSMTKAVGSLAAMILIDRGKLDAESTVESILPEFGELKLLEGFGADGPRLREPRVKATVRHLATHTSGLVYTAFDPNIARYQQAATLPGNMSGRWKALNYPMVFEPGERWKYGTGIDWLGLIVERIDGRRIDRFCREEIFDPLLLPDTRFEVEEHMAARLASVKRREADGGFADQAFGPPSNPEFYGMGHALYSTAPDYMRFLRLFLNAGALDGVRILSEAAIAQMLSNQIGTLEIPRLTSVTPAISADVELFPGAPKSHSFAFMRFDGDIPGMRRAGSQGWAGILNTHYWFDPAANLAAVLMTQSLPFIEPRFAAAYERFERAVYRGLRAR